jgi:hypothetical protein
MPEEVVPARAARYSRRAGYCGRFAQVGRVRDGLVDRFRAFPDRDAAAAALDRA